jgi:fatty-acyl-CoA synthase
VPLNARFGTLELRSIESDAECSALITTRDVGVSLAERFDLGTGEDDCIIVASRVGAGGRPTDLRDILAGSRSPSPVTIAPGDISAIFYTSGSTGLPKGTVQTNETIVAYVFGYTIGLQFTNQERALIIAPLAFTGSCLSLLIPMLLIGACSVIEKSFDPERIVSQVQKEKITFMTQVPAIWDRLPSLPGWKTADLSSVRIALTGGAPVPVSLLETYRAKGVAIRQVYGCTEIGAMACFPPVALAMARPTTVGYPQVTLKARVVGHDGIDCAPGVVGELWLKGPQVMKGYWRKPEMTEAAFVDGWYKTGDLVTMDADETITIVDRLKNMIISGGVKIYPAEIERALASIDCIQECGVFGASDVKWGQRAVAIIYASTPVDIDALRLEMRTLLGPLKTPRDIALSPKPLPKTVTNKISRHELPALYISLTGAEPPVKVNTL